MSTTCEWGNYNEMGTRLSLGLANRSAAFLLTFHLITHWGKVNTRCIYHRLTRTGSSPDNLTLCPILDFANHTYGETFTHQGETFDTRPSAQRKFGENFVLLSPSTSTVVAGDQLFLRYGMHANSTLFTEYGFVNIVEWHNLPQSFQAEVEIDSYMEALFERRGELGSFMKNILLEEGYWRLT